MIKRFYQGSQFDVCVWGEGDEYATLDFLDELKAGGKPQQQDYETLVKRRIEQMADHGQIRNKEQCKELEDGIFEFKAGNGSRLLWFYDPEWRAVVICTHGFHKPAGNKGYRPEIARACKVRENYQKAIAAWKASQPKLAPTAKTSAKRNKK